jgi:hypothetical protein
VSSKGLLATPRSYRGIYDQRQGVNGVLLSLCPL